MFRLILSCLSLFARCLPKLFFNQAITILSLQKELDILSRNLSPAQKRSRCMTHDRFILAALSTRVHALSRLFSPATILSWQRSFLKMRWTFPPFSHPGRPPTPASTKELILDMKNHNLTWGAGHIKGELKKLGIDLARSTIAAIIRAFRKQGKIRTALSWKRFLSSQAASLFAMDFFTVDLISGTRLYAFFLISHLSRKIVHFSLTEFPTREFVRQRIILCSEEQPDLSYLIHDRGPELCSLDYSLYGIKDVTTSARAPNMNAIAERFVRSVRRECLDWFLLISEGQVRRILREYIDYYNALRPHQGINQEIPDGYEPQREGRISSIPIWGGLHHHYFRKAA